MQQRESLPSSRRRNTRRGETQESRAPVGASRLIACTLSAVTFLGRHRFSDPLARCRSSLFWGWPSQVPSVGVPAVRLESVAFKARASVAEARRGRRLAKRFQLRSLLWRWQAGRVSELHHLGVGAEPGLRQSGVHMPFLMPNHLRVETAGRPRGIARAQRNSHNKPVNADAQGRPRTRCASCAPLRGRGLHARYVAGRGSQR